MMRRTYAALAVLALIPVLAGCTATPESSPATPPAEHSENAARNAAVTLNDGWAKAGTGMSGVFGTLQNNTDEALTITGQNSDAANLVELHEVTADGIMQEITGPVIIPAGGTLTLAPGSTHIMLMEMPAAILAGDTVTVTLELSNGSAAPLSALVKEYSGANESYGDTDHSTHDDHDRH